MSECASHPDGTGSEVPSQRTSRCACEAARLACTTFHCCAYRSDSEAGPVSTRWRREEIVDLAHHLDAAARDEHEIVGNPLELGEDVRRQHDRDAVVRDRRHHRRHEVVPGERIEHCHRLVEHEELRPARQRQRQRELGLLAA